MRTDLGNKVYSIVRRHIGREDAISAPDICRELHWPMSRERLVRQLISDESHLWTGLLVCAVAGAGYFCAGTFEEARQYRNWLADLLRQADRKLTRFEASCHVMGIYFMKSGNRKAETGKKAA